MMIKNFQHKIQEHS